MNYKSRRVVVSAALAIISLVFLYGIGEATEIKIRIIEPDANIRYKPTTESVVLSQIPIGAILAAEEKADEWYRVNLPPDEKGFVVTGYIHQSKVEVLEEVKEIPTEEEVPVEKLEVKEEIVPERKLYVKGILGLGASTEKVSMKMLTSEGKAYVGTGGGVNIEGVLGYYIIPTLMIEIGMAYQHTSMRPRVKDGMGWFSRVPLTATLIIQPPTKTPTQLYVGVGAGLYLFPKLYREWEGHVENTVKYKSPFGFHGLVGLNYRSPKKPSLFFFGEVKVAGVLEYFWEEHTENGIECVPFSEWKELGGVSVFFNFGFGYYF